MNKKKVLIVEDTSFFSSMLEDSFSSEYEVSLAMDGDIAIKKAIDELPDIIILDVVLPKKDGFEVCELLKKDEKTKDIPIIMLTSLADSKHESKGLEFGAIDYVKKPFSLKLLKNRIKNQLAISEQFCRLKNEEDREISIINESIEKIIKSLGILVEYRDDDTGKHIERTKSYMRMLAFELKDKYPNELNDKTIDVLSQSAILHDIGKVGIADSILLKKGRLTLEEFEEIKSHTIKGRDIISDVEAAYGQHEFLNIAKTIAEFHHEKWDGSGYPHGLKGKDIPLYARMMSIIDVYDALTSERPYKRAFSHEEAIDIIHNGDDRVKPSHFDPEVLEAFNNIQEKFRLNNI